VRAALEARLPGNSVLIDSAFVHENNNVWVMTDDDRLDIRSVDILYRDATQTVISAGLEPGDAVITSELTAPIQGMPIRVDSSPAEPATGDSAASDDPADAEQPESESFVRDAGTRGLRLSGPPDSLAADSTTAASAPRALAKAKTEPNS
jgi:hypothetical protein